MSIVFALAVYFIIWWVVLFVTLPFGARSAHEEGIEVVEGTERSAPLKPRLMIKFLVTTVLSAILFAIFYFVYTKDVTVIGSLFNNLTPSSVYIRSGFLFTA